MEACRRLKEGLPGFSFLYSIKANPYPAMVQTIWSQGFGADAASASEVLLARRTGLAAGNVYYSSPGKTRGDIESVFGRCLIIADSLGELRLINEVAKEKGRPVDIGLRINPDFSIGDKAGGPSKFGVDVEQLVDLDFSGKTYPYLRLVGIHVHLKSQVLQASLLAPYYQNCFNLAVRLSEKEGVSIDFINFGGGLGRLYSDNAEAGLDLEDLSGRLEGLLAYNKRTLKAELILETGRFVAAGAGSYYTRIVGIKESRGRKYLLVDKGMNGFLRPALAQLLSKLSGPGPLEGQEPLYTSAGAHGLFLLPSASDDGKGDQAGAKEGEEVKEGERAKKGQERVTVVGSLCTGLDTLAEGLLLPPCQVGDIIGVSHAGAYAYSLSPLLFSSQQPPGQYYLKRDASIVGEDDKVFSD